MNDQKTKSGDKAILTTPTETNRPVSIEPTVIDDNGVLSAQESARQVDFGKEKNAQPTPTDQPGLVRPTSNLDDLPHSEDVGKKLGLFSNKKLVLIMVAAFLVVLGGGIATYAFSNKPTAVKKPIVTKKKVIAPPKPTTVASNLTGLQVDPIVNQRPVTGVMIENSLEARPQSGLDQAGIVFEAIAEGGITRFLALFQDSEPDYIGPVRSARPYYALWCLTYDCAYAHVGGSPEALANIPAWGVKDMNQFAHGGSFWRITGRYAPHNVYTSMAKMRELQAAKGFAAAAYTPIVRKTEAPSKTPTARSINVNISGANFNSHYDWDAASNSYRRSQAGQPHLNVNGAGAGAQISPKVVVVMVMPYGIAADKHSNYGTVGSGQAYVFQDGVVTVGSWAKPDSKAQFTFTDSAGAPIALNAGQTWLVALGGSGNLNYQ